MAGGHYQQVCEFGLVHGQCRCPSPTKMQVTVKCNMPEQHEKLTGVVPKVGAMKDEIRKPLMDVLKKQLAGPVLLDGKIVFDPDEDEYFFHVRLNEHVLIFQLDSIHL